MQKNILLPNYRGALQMTPKTLNKVFGANRRIFLFVFFKDFFIIAKFDETKALAEQPKIFMEYFQEENTLHYHIESMASAQFRLSLAQMKPILSEPADIFIWRSGTIATDDAEHIPYIAVQPARIDSLICSAFQRHDELAGMSKRKGLQ